MSFTELQRPRRKSIVDTINRIDDDEPKCFVCGENRKSNLEMFNLIKCSRALCDQYAHRYDQKDGKVHCSDFWKQNKHIYDQSGKGHKFYCSGTCYVLNEKHGQPKGARHHRAMLDYNNASIPSMTFLDFLRNLWNISADGLRYFVYPYALHSQPPESEMAYLCCLHADNLMARRFDIYSLLHDYQFDVLLITNSHVDQFRDIQQEQLYPYSDYEKYFQFQNYQFVQSHGQGESGVAMFLKGHLFDVEDATNHELVFAQCNDPSHFCNEDHTDDCAQMYLVTINQITLKHKLKNFAVVGLFVNDAEPLADEEQPMHTPLGPADSALSEDDVFMDTAETPTSKPTSPTKQPKVPIFEENNNIADEEDIEKDEDSLSKPSVKPEDLTFENQQKIVSKLYRIGDAALSKVAGNNMIMFGNFSLSYDEKRTRRLFKTELERPLRMHQIVTRHTVNVDVHDHKFNCEHRSSTRDHLLHRFMSQRGVYVPVSEWDNTWREIAIELQDIGDGEEWKGIMQNQAAFRQGFRLADYAPFAGAGHCVDLMFVGGRKHGLRTIDWGQLSVIQPADMADNMKHDVHMANWCLIDVSEVGEPLTYTFEHGRDGSKSRSANSENSDSGFIEVDLSNGPSSKTSIITGPLSHLSSSSFSPGLGLHQITETVSRSSSVDSVIEVRSIKNEDSSPPSAATTPTATGPAATVAANGHGGRISIDQDTLVKLRQLFLDGQEISDDSAADEMADQLSGRKEEDDNEQQRATLAAV